ncbi:CTLH/CRA C-terminal to lish motif domain-containing protein [Cytidiella melzeri]|nr:CTLH/CRA C-terminal to lish motif domain-containing protein [Cytidiella melzeri]
MEASLKELTKLEKLASSSAKGKSPCIADSLDSLMRSLRETKERIQTGNIDESSFSALSQKVDSTKKDIDDRQKEVYNSLAKFGKTLDKRFTTPLPSYQPLFSSPEAVAALEQTIARHFLRTGQFETAETFISESGVNIEPSMRSQFLELHQIVTALKAGNIVPALEWAAHNRPFLQSRSSPLEFHLHRSQYMRLLLSTHPTHVPDALKYAKTNFSPFYPQHAYDINRLMNCITYVSRLQLSPYADLASSALHYDLEPMFAKEFCASLGMSRQVPLRVVGDLGGGGALARIEKGRKVMRERKSEWSQSDELPIEIPLLPENRYHSIFACPVSKEQSTDSNPPMLMSCGHVITKDSLQKLSKPGGRVKCPYCPNESQMSSALRMHF